MAKKTPERGTRVGALTGPRTLTMMAPSYTGAWAVGGWNVTGDAATSQWGNGWQAVGTTGIYYETYMDLSGYELDDLTFFPIEAGFQDPGLYSIDYTGATPPNMWVMDIMSQQRLNPSTLVNMLNPLLNGYNNAPGMMGSNVEYSEITMGNLRVMGLSTQVRSAPAPMITQNASAFGSGDPVVVQKLWCYRFVLFETTTAGDTMKIPASRFVLVGNAQKESDLVYMQRLKNSYETQGAV